MALKRVEVKYTGQVQGVGFRFTAERLANAYKVVGYVRNLADGGVELVAEGEESTLKNFLAAVRDEMEYYIEHISTNWFPPTGEFSRFNIRF